MVYPLLILVPKIDGHLIQFILLNKHSQDIVCCYYSIHNI